MREISELSLNSAGQGSKILGLARYQVPSLRAFRKRGKVEPQRATLVGTRLCSGAFVWVVTGGHFVGRPPKWSQNE